MRSRGGRGVKSLQVFNLDRLSSLTVCTREIGKVKVGKTLGSSTKNGLAVRKKTSQYFLILTRVEEPLTMSPSASKFPSKPDYIVRNPVASAEWDRICEELRKLPYEVEAGEDPIVAAAMCYAAIARFREALDVQGRSEDTEPMAQDCDQMVGRYLNYLREDLLGIAPGPLLQIRLLE